MRAVGWASLSACLLASCTQSGGLPTLAVPNTKTDWVIYATAATMRPASPMSVHVMRTSDLARTPLRPDNLGAGDIDMFFAGLKAEDLPSNLTPDKLVFVDKGSDNAHRLPPLYNPQVLEKPLPVARQNAFIPTDDPTLSDSSLQERRDRLAIIIQDLAVEDGCTALQEPIHLNAIAAESINHLRLMSSGDVFIAMGATGRAAIGRLSPSSEMPMPIEVATGTIAIDPSDVVQFADLGDTEAMTADGVIVPGEVIVNFIGPFGGGIGQIEIWDDKQHAYAIDTPMLPASLPSPELFAGVRHVNLSGTPSLCGYGNALGPNQIGGIWCRAIGSMNWQVSGAFKNALSIDTLVRPRNASERPIAIDVAGTAYLPTSAGSFSPVVTPEINSGCSPPCAAFKTYVDAPAGSNLRAVIAGTSAQVVAVHDEGGSLSLQTLDKVQTALFGDERPAGTMALRFTASAFGPDGALWLGSKDPYLLRLTPDLSSAVRVCLPRDARGMAMTSIVAHPNGRLIVGITPAFLGFGRWQ